MDSETITDRLLRPREVAALLGVSRAQVYAPNFQAALGAVRILGSLRYRASAVETAMRHGIQAPDKETAR